MKNNMGNKYAITSSNAWRLSKVWKRSAIRWRIFDYACSICSFSASVGTIYIIAEYESATALVIALSALAATLTLMSFACNPSKQTANYRAAFQVLNAALVENTDENGEIGKDPQARKAIIRAIQKGECFIGKTYDTEMDYSQISEDGE